MSMTAVARKAGVSQATVSRVFNGEPLVSEQTRQRVEEAMKEIGYVPSRPSGRTPAPSRIRSIAVLALDDSLDQHGALSMSMFRGVQDAAWQEGISTFISRVDGEKALPDLLQTLKPDGALLIGTTANPGIERMLGRLPAVWLTSHGEGRKDAVLPGNKAIGAMAADYLRNQDCRQVAFLCAAPENGSYLVRGDAFAQKAAELGMKAKPLISPASKDGQVPRGIEEMEPRIVDLIQKFKALKQLPDGLFVPSDFMTALVYRALGRAGITPGKDLKIISCDNEEPYLASLSPRPATIDIAGEARGKRALHELLWRIRNPDDLVRTQLIVEPRLIDHESV